MCVGGASETSAPYPDRVMQWVALDRLLMDRRAFAVHDKQRVVFGVPGPIVIDSRH